MIGGHAPDGRRPRCRVCGAHLSPRKPGTGRFYSLVIAVTLVAITLISTFGGHR